MEFIDIEEIVLYSRLSMHLCTLNADPTTVILSTPYGASYPRIQDSYDSVPSSMTWQ